MEFRIRQALNILPTYAVRLDIWVLPFRWLEEDGQFYELAILFNSFITVLVLFSAEQFYENDGQLRQYHVLSTSMKKVYKSKSML